jgi:selenium-binding protein 1
MERWTPDPTFYPSPTMAAEAPAEQLAYVVAFSRGSDGRPERPDALAVVDVDDGSPSYGEVTGWLDLPNLGDELHHFGWNACSSALCPPGRTRMSSAATRSCPVFARRGST